MFNCALLPCIGNNYVGKVSIPYIGKQNVKLFQIERKKSLLTLSKKHKSILKLPSFEEKHGTRNFAFQAFENINIKKISKEFKQKVKLNIDYKISSKFKYKLFVTYIFFLIFNKEYAKDEILKDLK